jgi:hypothetical protein
MDKKNCRCITGLLLYCYATWTLAAMAQTSLPPDHYQTPTILPQPLAILTLPQAAQQTKSSFAYYRQTTIQQALLADWQNSYPTLKNNHLNPSPTTHHHNKKWANNNAIQIGILCVHILLITAITGFVGRESLRHLKESAKARRRALRKYRC